MKQSFGRLASGKEAQLYTISCGALTATVSDFGAHLVSLLVPDRNGCAADVVLGFDDAQSYYSADGFIGAPVGRNANRIAGASFLLGQTEVRLTPNEGRNNLHSGPDCYHLRFWKVEEHRKDSITLSLQSPDGDQGFPGNAAIRLTYRLDQEGGLHIIFDAVADKDTVFNLTNHSYFNLKGHRCTDAAMDQELMIPGCHFYPDDAENIPTGALRHVEGTPFDFRVFKPIGRDIGMDDESLKLQGGYDHNFEVCGNPCAILRDPDSGRAMSVYTDCPGIQFYAGNFLDAVGKGGIHYGRRSGVALETQFAPDAVHHPEWPQPFTRAFEHRISETIYKFSW